MLNYCVYYQQFIVPIVYYSMKEIVCTVIVTRKYIHGIGIVPQSVFMGHISFSIEWFNIQIHHILKSSSKNHYK